jgi:hypothetical protein
MSRSVAAIASLEIALLTIFFRTHYGFLKWPGALAAAAAIVAVICWARCGTF